MNRLWRGCVLSILCCLLLVCPVSAFEPGISGMAKIDDNIFLTVADTKNLHGSDGLLAANPAPRVRILTVRENDITSEVLSLKYEDLPPSDLEAACSLPARNQGILMAESGFFQGKYGRIFYVRIENDRNGWTGEVHSTFLPFSLKHQFYSTPKDEQIEGLACLETPNHDLFLVLALRGGSHKPGMLIWGKLGGLESNQPVFTKAGEVSLTEGVRFFGNRDASDVFLQKHCEEEWQVWTIAVDDPGGKFGPFQSVIYSPGTFSWDESHGLLFHPTRPLVGWKREGLKVEALAGPAKQVENSVLSIGTEEEALGGMWFPLFPDENNP